MLSREEVLWLYMRRLGLTSGDLSGFAGRKVFQKCTYLLQQKPFDRPFGFGFSLYLYGPYSPDLAAVGFEILQHQTHFGDVTDRFVLTDAAEQNAATFERIFLERKPDPDFLELCATYHFLFSRSFAYLPQTERKKCVVERLEALKPHLRSLIPNAEKVLGAAGMLM